MLGRILVLYGTPIQSDHGMGVPHELRPAFQPMSSGEAQTGKRPGLVHDLLGHHRGGAGPPLGGRGPPPLF